MTIAKPTKLLDLVSYQPGAVVSREIINKPSGTVTIFAFDKGEGLSEHTTPFGALIYLLAGEAEVKVDSQPHRLKTGEMFIMPAHHPHSLKALTPFKMLLVMIKS